MVMYCIQTKSLINVKCIHSSLLIYLKILIHNLITCLEANVILEDEKLISFALNIVTKRRNCSKQQCFIETLISTANFTFCIKQLSLGKTMKNYDWLIDWLGFNAVFNNFSVISRPVHLLMHFLVFSHQYSTQQSSQATGCFPT